MILNAVNRAALAKQIADAKAQGRGVRDVLLAGRAGQDVLYNTGTPQQNADDRRDPRAPRSSRDSGGKANTLYVNVSAFEILAALGTEFEQQYKQFCPTASPRRSTSR